MQNITWYSCSAILISCKGDEISRLSHLVFEIWRGDRGTDDRRDDWNIKLYSLQCSILRMLQCWLTTLNSKRWQDFLKKERRKFNQSINQSINFLTLWDSMNQSKNEKKRKRILLALYKLYCWRESSLCDSDAGLLYTATNNEANQWQNRFKVSFTNWQTMITRATSFVNLMSQQLNGWPRQTREQISKHGGVVRIWRDGGTKLGLKETSLSQENDVTKYTQETTTELQQLPPQTVKCLER